MRFKIIEDIRGRKPIYTLLAGNKQIGGTKTYLQCIECLSEMVLPEDTIVEVYSDGRIVEYSGVEFREIEERDVYV